MLKEGLLHELDRLVDVLLELLFRLVLVLYEIAVFARAQVVEQAANDCHPDLVILALATLQ